MAFVARRGFANVAEVFCAKCFVKVKKKMVKVNNLHDKVKHKRAVQWCWLWNEL